MDLSKNFEPVSDDPPPFIEGMRVIIVGGIPTGVVLVGVGSRLAMLLLRVTSPKRVHGVTSDDGFTIGQFTVGGTYNLLMIGAAVGVIGAIVYRLVAPWLVGPNWFRRVTTGLGSGVVVGSMLIHSDGIDFNVLKPMWLAIGLFVALPALFGSLIGVTVDAVSRPTSWTNQGRRRLIIPVVAVVCFPLSVLPLLVAAVVVAFGTVRRELDPEQRTHHGRSYNLAIRGLWLFVALAGLFALINDIQALA